MTKGKKITNRSTSVLTDASYVVMKKLHTALVKLNAVLEESIRKTKPAASMSTLPKKKKSAAKNTSKKTKVKKSKSIKKTKKLPGKKTKVAKNKLDQKAH